MAGQRSNQLNYVPNFSTVTGIPWWAGFLAFNGSTCDAATS